MAEPKFTVLFEKLRGTTFELNKETMSIGRRDGMDICIKDSSMSGKENVIIGKLIPAGTGMDCYKGVGVRKVEEKTESSEW